MARDESLDGQLICGVTVLSDGDREMVVVPPEATKEVGDRIFHLLESAAKYGLGGYDPEWFMNLCSTRKANLWVGVAGDRIVGTLITMPVSYPHYVALRVVLAGGDIGCLEQFGPLVWRALQKWARYCGATKIEAWGRPGWARALSRVIGVAPVHEMRAMLYDVQEED